MSLFGIDLLSHVEFPCLPAVMVSLSGKRCLAVVSYRSPSILQQWRGGGESVFGMESFYAALFFLRLSRAELFLA